MNDSTLDIKAFLDKDEPFGLSKVEPYGFSGKSSALRLRYFPEKPCTIRHGTVRQARNKIPARRSELFN